MRAKGSHLSSEGSFSAEGQELRKKITRAVFPSMEVSLSGRQ